VLLCRWSCTWHSTAAACIWRRGSLPLKLGGTCDLGPGALLHPALVKTSPSRPLLDKVPYRPGQRTTQHPLGTRAIEDGSVGCRLCRHEILPASPQARRCSQPLVDGAISTKHWATTWRQAAAAALADASAMLIAASLMQVSICHGHCGFEATALATLGG